MSHLITSIKAIADIDFMPFPKRMRKFTHMLSSQRGSIALATKGKTVYTDLLPKGIALMMGPLGWRIRTLLEGLVQLGRISPNDAQDYIDQCDVLEARANLKRAAKSYSELAVQLGLTISPFGLRRLEEAESCNRFYEPINPDTPQFKQLVQREVERIREHRNS